MNKIFLLIGRHGNTLPVEEGKDDLSRVLSEKGYEQPKMTAHKLHDLGIGPIDLAFASNAGRAENTGVVLVDELNHICHLASPVKVTTLACLYPDAKRLPVMNKAFEVLKYSSLGEYVMSRQVAEELGKYVKESYDDMEPHIVKALKAKGKNPLTVSITSHAVCSNSLVLALQRRFGDSDYKRLADTGRIVMDEGAVFVVEIEVDGDKGIIKNITYVTPKSV